MPKLPCGVSATIRVTLAFSRKTQAGTNTLICMAGDTAHAGLSLFASFVNPADHVEGRPRIVPELIAQYALTSVERVLNADEPPGHARKLFGREKWLG